MALLALGLGLEELILYLADLAVEFVEIVKPKWALEDRDGTS